MAKSKRQKRFYGVVEQILPEVIGRPSGAASHDYVACNAPDKASVLLVINDGTVVNTFVLYRVLITVDGAGKIVNVTQERWSGDE